MPQEIRAIKIDDSELGKRYRESLKLSNEIPDGWVAFAYPGKFIGTGDTAEDAMHMAKMRLRSQKKKFLEKNPEEDWDCFAKNRREKLDKVHDKLGIKLDSTWNEDNIEKK
jgi:hypothetical protein